MFMRLKLLNVLHWLIVRPIQLNWTAAAVVGGAIIQGAMGQKGAESAATATKDATIMQIRESGRQFDVAQEQLAPYREIGEEFLPDMRNFMRGDYKGFLDSPDYKFTKEEGEKAIDRKASAAGSRYGGRALKEAAGYAEGLASTHIDKYFNKLFNVTNIGASAAAGTAQAALQTGAQNVAAYGQQGAALGNISMQNATNQANIAGSTIGNLTTLSMYNDMMKQGSTTAATT